MQEHEELFSKVKEVSEGAKHTITKILSGLDKEVVKNWLDKLKVNDGRVAGTFYSDIGARLTFNEFVALYEALGYDFGQMSVWKDWWCYGAEGCKRQNGYTCDPNRCP